MSLQFSAPTRSFASTAALNRYRRVTMTAGVLAYAGANEVGLGVLEVTTTTDDEVGAVRLPTAEGTQKMVASGAITALTNVYAAASGKIASSGSVKVGVALEAAGADGDVIEVLPIVDLGGLLYNQVAAGTALTNSTTETLLGSFTIPANTLKAGDLLRFRYQGIATATNSTDTLLHKLYIGGLAGTALLTGTA